MLRGVARLAIAAPRRVVAIAILVMVGAAIFGLPVATSLSAGGFEDPTAESRYAADLIAAKFNRGDMEMVITITAPGGAGSGAASAVGTGIVEQLGRSPHVAYVASPWTAPQSVAATLISKDGKTGLIVAGIDGGERFAPGHAQELADRVVFDRDGVTVRGGGRALSYSYVSAQCQRDLLLMEAIAIPLSFLVLVWVFGGLLAAALPLAVAAVAILVTTAVLRGLTFGTDVSIFALNLTLAMGLALAIDYTLLIISRFRDELADGAQRDDALIATMATAGRTVLFSAMTVALSLIALLLFPMFLLRSFAYAGVAVVAAAGITSVVLTPAIIVLLGDRLDSLDVRTLLRRWSGRRPPAYRSVEETFWYRLIRLVMRHAVPIALAITALLIVLGAPFLGAKWGYPDDRVVPTSTSVRQVGDAMRNDFAVDPAANVLVVIPDASGVPPGEINRYAADLSRVTDVSAVSAPAGTFVDGAPAGPPSSATGINDGSAFLTVNSTAKLFTEASDLQLEHIRAIVGPERRQVMLTGVAQINLDSAHAVSARLPIVLAVIGTVTFIVMFLLTGSLILPLKTLALNVLSLSAAFGALVWIFQSGHLGGLGTTPTGTLVAHIPVLLFCVAFGLSMDYEVFLVARIREYWLRSGRTTADNAECVALGIARTARVVTAAALLMAIAFAALLTAQVSFMKMLGLGLTLAVVVDATLVRMLLMPAFMHLLGRWNWWAPQPLVRLHERFGISESDDSPDGRDREATSVPAAVNEAG